LGLPCRDGLDVFAELRRRSVRLPVIVLTARTTTADVVTGLDAGANDYIKKPFRLAELLARVRLQLRPGHRPEEFILRNGGFSLDLRTRQATVNGKVVDLSSREFALAEMFLRHPGQVLAASRSSATSGATITTRCPTSSRSTSATCGARSAPAASTPSAAPDTG
jgi:two-component system, OmpR family, response regulator